MKKLLIATLLTFFLPNHSFAQLHMVKRPAGPHGDGGAPHNRNERMPFEKGNPNNGAQQGRDPTDYGNYVHAELQGSWQPAPYEPSQNVVSLREANDRLKSQVSRRNDVRETIKGMDQYEVRYQTVVYASHALNVSRQYYLERQFENGLIAAHVADVLLDLATSLTPGVSWARDLYEAVSGKHLHTGEALDTFERSMAVMGALTVGFASKMGRALMVIENIAKGGHVTESFKLASKILKNAGPASEIRNSVGTAIASSPLADMPKMMRGTHRNAGLVPKEVGDKLVGREFRSFDKFREEFWTAVSETKYIEEFDSIDQLLIKAGKAPTADKLQHLKGAKKLQLHHIQPINQGGHVYDVSNIMIVTPRFHQEVLEKVYHYGK